MMFLQPDQWCLRYCVCNEPGKPNKWKKFNPFWWENLMLMILNLFVILSHFIASANHLDLTPLPYLKGLVSITASKSFCSLF